MTIETDASVRLVALERPVMYTMQPAVWDLFGPDPGQSHPFLLADFTNMRWTNLINCRLLRIHEKDEKGQIHQNVDDPNAYCNHGWSGKRRAVTGI